MSVKVIIAVASTLLASAAFAQSLGTVGNVNGLITVTDGVTGGTVTPGSQITNGMRFVTTSGASMTLQLNNGCSVPVPANHAVTVLQSMTCQELISAVQPVGGGAVGAGGGSPLVGGLSVAGLTLATGIVSKQVLDNKSISGN